jgi:hypothetical protein
LLEYVVQLAATDTKVVDEHLGGASMPIRRSCGLPGRPSVHDGRDDAVVTPEDQVVQVG